MNVFRIRRSPCTDEYFFSCACDQGHHRTRPIRSKVVFGCRLANTHATHHQSLQLIILRSHSPLHFSHPEYFASHVGSVSTRIPYGFNQALPRPSPHPLHVLQLNFVCLFVHGTLEMKRFVSCCKSLLVCARIVPSPEGATSGLPEIAWSSRPIIGLAW